MQLDLDLGLSTIYPQTLQQWCTGDEKTIDRNLQMDCPTPTWDSSTAWFLCGTGSSGSARGESIGNGAGNLKVSVLWHQGKLNANSGRAEI